MNRRSQNTTQHDSWRIAIICALFIVLVSLTAANTLRSTAQLGVRFVAHVASVVPASLFTQQFVPTARPLVYRSAPVIRRANQFGASAIRNTEARLEQWHEAESQKGLFVLLAAELLILTVGVCAYFVKRQLDPQTSDYSSRTE